MRPGKLVTCLFVSGCLCSASGQMVHGVSSTPSPSTTMRLFGSGLAAHTFSISEMKALPHTTITARNGHTGVDESWSGVLLTDLLTRAGAPVGKDLHGKVLSEYLVATGADGYKAVLALAETDPGFHPGDVIVADTLNGQPLDAQTGSFKLVVSEDKRPARSVHSLVSVELRTAE